jgi:hypothetical protein
LMMEALGADGCGCLSPPPPSELAVKAAVCAGRVAWPSCCA